MKLPSTAWILACIEGVIVGHLWGLSILGRTPDRMVYLALVVIGLLWGYEVWVSRRRGRPPA